jgi:hypothetical protein
MAGGPSYLVIATRADGSRLVLDGARSRERAEALRRLYAGRLEGYVAIRVERIERLPPCERRPRPALPPPTKDKGP